MNPKSKTTVEDVVSTVLGISREVITNETSPANTEEWDSFNGLLLATELEKKFCVKFSFEEVLEVKNVGDIKKILKRHNIQV